MKLFHAWYLILWTVNETAVIRWAYGDPTLGTCQETIKGGNHFRYWEQDGNQADSGAIFMALSYEKPLSEGHDIVDNGYNLGRDWFVGNITGNTTIPTANLTNSSTYSGSMSANGYTYQTDVQYVSGLLGNTSDGINHYQSFTTNAADGLVAVLTVHITQAPQAASSFAYVLLILVLIQFSFLVVADWFYLSSSLQQPTNVHLTTGHLRHTLTYPSLPLFLLLDAL